MSGTDLKRLPADRMLNVIEYLFEKNILEEKEIHDAREKIRAQMRDAFSLKNDTTATNNSGYSSAVGTDASLRELKEGEIDEFGRTIPKKRQATASTKPALTPMLPSDDEDNPFPMLEGPLR